MKIKVMKKGRRQAKARAGKAKTLARKTVRLSASRLGALDVSKPTFTAELTSIFKRNIAKARRENKKLLGSLNGF